MRLKLPPVVIVAVFALGMYLLDLYLPFGEFDFFGRTLLIKVLWGLAILITLVAIFQFLRAGTTTSPVKPENATVLITNGIYRYSRNPMYLAMLLILLGYGLYLGNAFNTLLAAGFVYYMNAYQIKPEEEALTALYGREYTHYLRATRRWF